MNVEGYNESTCRQCGTMVRDGMECDICEENKEWELKRQSPGWQIVILERKIAEHEKQFRWLSIIISLLLLMRFVIWLAA